MKTEYPIFKRGQIPAILNKLPKTEQKILEDYVKYRGINITSPDKLKDAERHIVQLRFVTGKPLDKIELKDLQEFLSLLNKSERLVAGKEDVKVNVKNFLKWKFKDWSERFNDLEDIKTKSRQQLVNHKRLNSSTMLKKEEFENMMKTEGRLFWKTYLITLYQSALRPVELRKLTWDKIEFDVREGITKLNVFATKTKKSRVSYVKEATDYLKELKKKSDSPFVFPSPRDKNKPLTKPAVTTWIKKLSKEAIGREITCYILRHTRLDELYKNKSIDDKVVMKLAGHSKDVSWFYQHLSNEDVENAMSDVYNLEVMPKEKKHKLELEIEELKRTNLILAKGLAELGTKVNLLTGGKGKIEVVA